MEKYGAMIKNLPLFHSIDQGDLSRLLDCLGAETLHVPKDGYAMMAGEKPDSIGLVLTGALQVVREDAEGNRAILTTLGQGDFYGEALACAGVPQSPVSVLALSPSKIIRLSIHRVLTPCSHACAFHSALIRNLVGMIAQKNIQMQSRMEILDKKTIRERVLHYLTMRQSRPGEAFTIPLNRNAFADYLAVDRSALSRELGRLKGEGVIEFYGNAFRLLPHD